jgi:hypothetical protein
MFIAHQAVLDDGSFNIFPQLRLPWNLKRRGQACGYTRYVPRADRNSDGPPANALQGGAEIKVATELMRDLPPPIDVGRDPNVQSIVSNTIKQASDQVKAAIRKHQSPGVAVEWVVAVGPYFTIAQPFTDPQLRTRVLPVLVLGRAG